MAEPPNVRLHLASRPENVVLVREMLTGVAHAIELGGVELSDIRTAATEACNNVVLHAYRDAEGPLEVEVRLAPSALEVVVRDRGKGIGPRSGAGDGAGTTPTTPSIGLPVIHALAHRLELGDVVGGGTEVRMEFATPGTRVPQPPPAQGGELPAIPAGQAPAGPVLTIAPPRLAQTVLPRLLSALAARAHFSTDRISDVQLVADALVAHASEAVGAGYLNVAVAVEPRKLDLHVGPLDAGRAQRLLADSNLEGLGRVIERLTDRQRVASAGGEDLLALRLIDWR
jgi:serine/threonine-protein kinase RsbW